MIILPVVSYGRGARSLPLEDEQKLRLFDNKFPRTFIDIKRDETLEEL